MSRRWLVPGVPFLLSLVLSLSAISSNVFWPDSGFFLAGIRESGVLYPTGFVLYILLSRLWTALLFFVDFTLAAHLFSSFCAAGAAAAIAGATRDLLVSRGRWLGAGRDPEGGKADWAGAIAGCLAASGFTFWFAGLYAKPYAFLYLVLSLLLWSMVRADAQPSPRRFTAVAALIGLAGQAHPLSVLFGAALVAFVIVHARAVGWRGIVARTGLAALLAAGPTALLPLLSSRDPLLAFDEPRDFESLLAYLSARRYTGIRGVFGWDGERAAHAGLFLWQEWLGIGTALFALGAASLARWNRRAAVLLALWALPVVAFAVCFKIEHQLDHWCLAGWLALYPAIGAGAYAVAEKSGARARAILPIVAAASIVWSVLANHPVVNQRTNVLPERFGRFLLDRMEPDAIFVTGSDDTASLGLYFQIVRKEYRNILIVRASHLAGGVPGKPGWYDRQLLRRDPRLRIPDYALLSIAFPRTPRLPLATAAFVNENASARRPIYLEVPPPVTMIRPDFELVPAGPLWKVAPRGKERPDPRAWAFPMTAVEIRSRYRRPRAQAVEVTGEEVKTKAEPYERRLFLLIQRSRMGQASWSARQGDPAGARILYEQILADDPETGRLSEVIVPLAETCLALGDRVRALDLYRKALELPDLPPEVRRQVEARLRGN